MASALSVLAPGCRGSGRWALPDASPAPAIDRLLDHPDRVTLAPAGSTAVGNAPLPHAWDESGIARSWRRGGRERNALVSPRLPFASLAEIDRIEVTLATDHPPAGATLLWNDRESLSETEELRNRRELTLPLRRGTLTIRGAEVFDGSWHEPARTIPAFRHLLIQQPAKGRPATVESVRIVTVDEALAEVAAGRVRMRVDGETRDAFLVKSPGSLTYRTTIPAHAELTFGIASVGRATRIRYAVSAVAGAAASTPLVTGEHSAPGWRDVRVALAPTGGHEARITFSAESEPPGAAVLWSSPAIVRMRAEGEPPNVILYVLDALRPDRLGAYGYSGRSSPFLDALARRATVFRRAYAAATWTKPSVVSLMTSLYPQTHGVGGRTYTDALPEAVPVLADLLREAGYVTAQFTANPLAGALSNLDQGFESAVGPSGLRTPSAGPGAPKVRSEEINARLIPWLAAHAHDRFFVHVHTMDTHTPYAASATGAPPSGGRARMEAYDAEIRANDASLRRLYEALSALDLTRNTVIVVTADHGEAFGEHGLQGHGNSVHEEEARVPLIVADGRPPSVIDEPAHHVDIVPTILARCGIAFDPRLFEGEDVLASAPAEASRARALFVARFAYPVDDLVSRGAEREWTAVVEGRWKLVRREPWEEERPPGHALYDLSTDPLETRDLAEDRPRDLARLSRVLDDFRARQAARRARYLRRYPGPIAMGSAGSAPSFPASLLEDLRTLGYVR